MKKMKISILFFCLLLVLTSFLSVFFVGAVDNKSTANQVEMNYKELNSNTGWQLSENGKWKYKVDGKYVSSWQHLSWSGGLNWFYFDTDTNEMITGWKNKIPGWGASWFYFDPVSGAMSEGWKNNIAGWGASWFFFDRKTGVMATKWVFVDNDWYYMNQQGVMQCGWQLVDNVWYYLYKENDNNIGKYGSMASNRYIDNYWVTPNGSWLPDLQSMCDIANTYSSKTNYIILVSQTMHKVAIFSADQAKWNNLYFWDCCTGAPETSTPNGVYEIAARGYYFNSGVERCYYWTQFLGDYLFHSQPYDQNGNIADDRMGESVSLGCVRLYIDNAKWIYENIPSQTKVVIYN